MSKVVMGLIGLLLLLLSEEIGNRPKREYIYTKKDLKELKEIEKQLSELEEL